MSFDSEVDPLHRPDTPPSPYVRESGEDWDWIWVENSCRYANVIALLVGSVTIFFHPFIRH